MESYFPSPAATGELLATTYVSERKGMSQNGG